MKFVAIKSAKGLVPGTEVYTLDADGHYGVGRLVSKIEDAKGLHLEFEVPQYSEVPRTPKPITVNNITHVCLQRDRKLADDENQE
jgi:hypothetical protein